MHVGAPGRKEGPSAYLRAQRHLLGALGPRIPGRVLVGSVDECPLLLVPAPDGSASLHEPLSKALSDPRRPNPLIVSLSEHVAQLPTAGPACQEARDALEAGRRLGWHARVVHFRDVAAEVLLLRNPDIARLLLERIEPVAARPELLETLRAYLDSGLSARQTARRLYVHTQHHPVPAPAHRGPLGPGLAPAQSDVPTLGFLDRRKVGARHDSWSAIAVSKTMRPFWMT